MKASSGIGLAALAALAACGDGRAPPSAGVASRDAGPATTDAGVTILPSFVPATGYHVDLDVGEAARPRGRQPVRDYRMIQLLLRSTPSEALAAVDGVGLGPTPVLWECEANGMPREFTFVLAGHALARYRFVPVTSGIVHGTLVRVTDGQPRTDPPVAPGDDASGGGPTPPRGDSSGAVPDTMPKTVPDTTPKTVPDTTPKTVPDTMPKTVPDTTPGTVPDTTPGTAREGT